ncbi:hypothetical protein M758_5G064500 [Ceratodon purpureus]|nr:hypothetical protein M758_5G064500 [Ceratodon purpureus]
MIVLLILICFSTENCDTDSDVDDSHFVACLYVILNCAVSGSAASLRHYACRSCPGDEKGLDLVRATRASSGFTNSQVHNLKHQIILLCRFSFPTMIHMSIW